MSAAGRFRGTMYPVPLQRQRTFNVCNVCLWQHVDDVDNAEMNNMSVDYCPQDAIYNYTDFRFSLLPYQFTERHDSHLVHLP